MLLHLKKLPKNSHNFFKKPLVYISQGIGHFSDLSKYFAGMTETQPKTVFCLFTEKIEILFYL